MTIQEITSIIVALATVATAILMVLSVRYAAADARRRHTHHAITTLRPVAAFRVSFTESLYEKAARSEGDAREVLGLLIVAAKDCGVQL